MSERAPIFLTEPLVWGVSGTAGQVPTLVDTGITLDGQIVYRLEFQASVDPSAIAGLQGLVASKADLLSPNFLGTPKKNGVALATTADITGGSAVDPAMIAGVAGLVASKADLLSPNFLGTPKKNGAALATLADITGGTPDSDQNILATQIFGA